MHQQNVSNTSLNSSLNNSETNGRMVELTDFMTSSWSGSNNQNQQQQQQQQPVHFQLNESPNLMPISGGIVSTNGVNNNGGGQPIFITSSMSNQQMINTR